MRVDRALYWARSTAVQGLQSRTRPMSTSRHCRCQGRSPIDDSRTPRAQSGGPSGGCWQRRRRSGSGEAHGHNETGTPPRAMHMWYISGSCRHGRSAERRRSTRRSEVPAEAASRRAPSSSLSSTLSAHCAGSGHSKLGRKTACPARRGQCFWLRRLSPLMGTCHTLMRFRAIMRILQPLTTKSSQGPISPWVAPAACSQTYVAGPR